MTHCVKSPRRSRSGCSRARPPWPTRPAARSTGRRPSPARRSSGSTGSRSRRSRRSRRRAAASPRAPPDRGPRGRGHDATTRPAASHGGRTCVPTRAQRLLGHAQRPLHGDRLQPTHPLVKRRVEPVQQQHQGGEDRDDRADQHGLGDRALRAVGEEHHVREDHRRDEEQHDPERGRDHADGAVDAIEPRLLTRRRSGRATCRRPTAGSPSAGARPAGCETASPPTG